MQWLKKILGKSKSIKGIDHAAIVVSDMDIAFDFYSGVLGLDIVVDGRGEGGDKKSFLGAGTKAFLALTEDMKRKSSDPGKTDAVDHIAFLVDDLERSKKKLIENGVEIIEEKTDSNNYITAYHFLDPDGLELEICKSSNEIPTY